MAADPLTILRTYAQKDPTKFPSSILFRSTEKYFTIFDLYPKSIFHFLILPRLSKVTGFVQDDVANLKALLKADKGKAKAVLEEMKLEALEVKRQIEEEMVEMYGFKWDVWIGFHANPSLVHLHLHVVSGDLVSDRLKNKKHYNSFHPKRGFFLHVDDVLEWFEAEPSYFNRMAQLNPKTYEALLKHDLECFECYAAFKNMPQLKQHLQEEWDKLEKKAARRLALKRKARQVQGVGTPIEEIEAGSSKRTDSSA